MTSETSPENLRTFYADPRLLRDRQQTYAVPVSGTSFVDWVLDLVDLDPVGDVLDAGAGVGRFTLPIAGRTAARVIACDLFDGMLDTVSQAAAARGLRIETRVADIHALPFDPDRFDLVLANHVLYHLSDLDQGIRELARVTRPSGTLVATTNADDVPVAVVDLHLAALRRIGQPAAADGPSAFSLRNGEAVLRKGFTDVRLHTFRDQQLFEDAGALVAAYRTTGRFRAACGQAEIEEPDLVRAAEEIAAEWAGQQNGTVVSPVVMGAFLCTGPTIPGR